MAKKRKQNVRIRVILNPEEMSDLTLTDPGNGNDTPGGETDPGTPALTQAQFTLAATQLADTLPAYSNSRYVHPCTGFTLSHTEADAPRVKAWFSGDYTDVTTPPSASLVSNLSKSLNTLLNNYYAAASRAGMLTAPCRVGAALRLSDGSRLPLGEPVTLFPDTLPPVVAVRSYTPSPTMMTAYVEIFNLPKRVLLTLPAMAWSEGAGTATPVAVDFYATVQTAWSPDPLSCSGLRTMTVGEGDTAERLRGFVYDGYEEEYVAGRAAADTDFRVIGTMTWADARSGVKDVAIPLTAGAFSDWKTMPKLTWEATGGGTGGEEPTPEPDPFKPYLHLLTPPLDLGDPEKEKRVRGVTLRGMFVRDSVKLCLYGAHHREPRLEDWHKVAESEGAILRLVCGMRYRWWRVEIEASMRPGDFLEALVFTVL